jgi:hypothetical protein
MSATNLLSKIAAGGLTAGVFLIWWPGHIEGEGLGQLVLRGLLWTLAFELLMLAFAPLEDLVAGRLKTRLARKIERRRRTVVPQPARVVALASIGLVVPLLFIADPGAPKAGPSQREVKLVRKVVVQRPVIRREVVVRPEIVSPAPPAPVVKRVVVQRRAKSAPAAPKARAKVEPAPAPAPAPTPEPAVEPAAAEPQQP